MKPAFNNWHDVIHLFAQQSQPHAKSPNVFFYNDKIYSYGYHYLLAAFIENKKGEKAILINNERYSRTTGKHISTMIQASRQYRQFYKTHTDKKIILEKFVLIFWQYVMKAVEEKRCPIIRPEP